MNEELTGTTEEQKLACYTWFVLLFLQTVFIVLRITGAIRWHWLTVLIPLWMFLSLPFVSWVTLVLLKK